MGQTASSSVAPEQQAFRQVYVELLEAIQEPVYLAANLYSAGMLPLAVRAEMTTPGVSRFEKNEKLLTAVESQIKTTPQKFARFLSVLSRDSSMESLVEKLQNAYEREAGGGRAQNEEKTKPRRITRGSTRSERKSSRQIVHVVRRIIDSKFEVWCFCVHITFSGVMA